MPIRSGFCATASRSTRSTTKTASSRRFSAASARRTRTFVEFGVETGVECNSVKLLIEGWRGLWIEANAQACKTIASIFDAFLNDRRLTLQQSLVTAENINALIEERRSDGEIDLLSIDIDFNDYWVWKAIEAVSPRVVVIEYNAGLRPPMSLTVPYQPNRAGGGTNFFGASLEALVRLGRTRAIASSAAISPDRTRSSCARISAPTISSSPQPPRSTTSRRGTSFRSCSLARKRRSPVRMWRCSAGLAAAALARLVKVWCSGIPAAPERWPSG